MTNPYAHFRQSLGRPLFVPFTVLGDPDIERSKEIVRTLIGNGADALELGFPFSDPSADGPVIQAADKRALEAGVRIDDCFGMLHELRNGKSCFEGLSMTERSIPIGLLVYFNLVLQRGIGKFYRDCAEAGVASVLIGDLPLEHIDQVSAAAKEEGVASVFMVSELTSDERLRQICAVAGGYIYLVSYVGITGIEDAVLGDRVRTQIQRIRRFTDLPVFVGFGINTPEQAQAVIRAGADGVIVGSRIVKEVPDTCGIAQVCREMKAAIA